MTARFVSFIAMSSAPGTGFKLPVNASGFELPRFRQEFISAPLLQLSGRRGGEQFGARSQTCSCVSTGAGFSPILRAQKTPFVPCASASFRRVFPQLPGSGLGICRLRTWGKTGCESPGRSGPPYLEEAVIEVSGQGTHRRRDPCRSLCHGTD